MLKQAANKDFFFFFFFQGGKSNVIASEKRKRGKSSFGGDDEECRDECRETCGECVGQCKMKFNKHERILTSVYIKVSLFPHFRIRFQTQHPIPLVTGAKSRIDVVSPLLSSHLMFCMQKQNSLPRISGNNTDQLGLLPRHALETSGSSGVGSTVVV
jgi:hypothetical protein